MLRFVAARVGLTALLLWATATITFLLIYLAPGDPARTLAARMIGRMPPPEQVEAVRVKHGLDNSPVDQYRFWLGAALGGDFGKSFASGRPVLEEIGPRLVKTLQLSTAAFCLALLLALSLGLAAAVHPGGLVDRLSQALALLGSSLPSFWVGFILIYLFASRLGLLPTHGAESWQNLVLPTLTLALAPAARMTRLVQVVVSEVLGMPHLITARAKGLRRPTILWDHARRLAAVALLSRLSREFAFVAGGAVVVETVFAWPGIGGYFVDAVETRDLPVIQALTLTFGALLALASLVGDVLAYLADPRPRARGAAQ